MSIKLYRSILTVAHTGLPRPIYAKACFGACRGLCAAQWLRMKSPEKLNILGLGLRLVEAHALCRFTGELTVHDILS